MAGYVAMMLFPSNSRYLNWYNEIRGDEIGAIETAVRFSARSTLPRDESKKKLFCTHDHVRIFRA